jgi:hypothetical protein
MSPACHLPLNRRTACCLVWLSRFAGGNCCACATAGDLSNRSAAEVTRKGCITWKVDFTRPRRLMLLQVLSWGSRPPLTDHPFQAAQACMAWPDLNMTPTRSPINASITFCASLPPDCIPPSFSHLPSCTRLVPSLRLPTFHFHSSFQIPIIEPPTPSTNIDDDDDPSLNSSPFFSIDSPCDLFVYSFFSLPATTNSTCISPLPTYFRCVPASTTA